MPTTPTAPPNNWDSIVGGLFRAFQSNKASAGLNQQNVTVNNPQSYAWIGFSSGDQVPPITKEQTQNPALPFNTGSAGIQYAYSKPVLTDIGGQIASADPGTDIGPKYASSIGSLVQPMPPFVPINNLQLNNLGMMPMNGNHFMQYFANQKGMQNMSLLPNISHVQDAISVQQQTNTGNAGNGWLTMAETFQMMSKSYAPANNFRGT